MIVLTRPQPAAHRFARMLRGRGATVPILFSPIVRIETCGGAQLPGGTLIFTSENGVRAAAQLGALTGRKVVAVGPRTAAVAQAHGADATAMGGDVTNLAAALIAKGGGPFVHLHGQEVTGDLSADLRAAGLRAEGRAIYRQTPIALSDAARSAVLSDRPTILPLFSARSAEWVARDLGAPPLSSVAVALSAKVRESWPWSGAALVASTTEIAAMCDAVMQAIASRNGERTMT